MDWIIIISNSVSLLIHSTGILSIAFKKEQALAKSQ